MTFKESRNLKKGRFVQFAGERLKFLRMEKDCGNWYVVVLPRPRLRTGNGFVMQNKKYYIQEPVRLLMSSCSLDVPKEKG